MWGCEDPHVLKFPGSNPCVARRPSLFLSFHTLQGRSNVPLRERFGWNPFFEHQAASLARGDLHFARIVEEQRGLYHVAGDAEGWLEVSGRFRHEAVKAADFPAVGDWVGVNGGIIHVRLERCGKVSRAAAGRAVDEQVVAANVDVIFLVTTLDRDLNPRRLERYLTMVWD